MKTNRGTLICLLFAFAFAKSFSQKINLQDINLNSPTENISVQTLFTDSSIVSSFIIQIKKNVKTHKHEKHAEHVFVIEGQGTMELGDEQFSIKQGDLIFIPANTFHSVETKSKIPLKVISIQAPFFDGKDRIFKTSVSDSLKQN